jgi:hypothetical protein
MYVHYSNKVINILRVTETHMLTAVVVIAKHGMKNGSEAAGPLLNDRAAGHDLVLEYCLISVGSSVGNRYPSYMSKSPRKRGVAAILR